MARGAELVGAAAASFAVGWLRTAGAGGGVLVERLPAQVGNGRVVVGVGVVPTCGVGAASYVARVVGRLVGRLVLGAGWGCAGCRPRVLTRGDVPGVLVTGWGREVAGWGREVTGWGRDTGAGCGRDTGAGWGRDAGAGCGRETGAGCGRDAGAGAGRELGAGAGRTLGAGLGRTAPASGRWASSGEPANRQSRNGNGSFLGVMVGSRRYGAPDCNKNTVSAGFLLAVARKWLPAGHRSQTTIAK